MKPIYLFAVLIVACAKVPDYKAAPLEQDQSSTLVAEEKVKQQGCEFYETADRDTQVRCQPRSTFEEYYDQRAALLEYRLESDQFMKTPAFSEQNQTTKIFLVGKNMASSLAVWLESFKAENLPANQDLTVKSFYTVLLRIAIEDHLLVKFVRDSGAVDWILEGQGSLSPINKMTVHSLREELKKADHPQAKIMTSVLDALEQKG
jgi:hypothetical protein